MISELGRGSYGVVNKVLSLVDHEVYVMKKINMKHIKMKHQKEALKEAQILKRVRHTNIIRYYTSFVEDDYLYIIMEYAEGGDLAVVMMLLKVEEVLWSIVYYKYIYIYSAFHLLYFRKLHADNLSLSLSLSYKFLLPLFFDI